MIGKKSFIIYIQILILVLFTSCSSDNEQPPYKYLSTLTYPTDEEYVSEIKLDFNGNPIVYGGYYSSPYIYYILKGEKDSPVLDEKVKKQINGFELSNVEWEQSDIYFEDDGGYISIGDRDSYGTNVDFVKRFIAFDENLKKIYDINIGEIIEENFEGKFNPILVRLEVYKCEDDKISIIINNPYGTSTVVILNPYNQEILNTFEFDFIPKFVVGNQLVGLLYSGNQISFMDLQNGEITKTLNFETYGALFGIGFSDSSVYYINKTGIYIANENDTEFKCIIDSKDMFAFEEDIKDERYIKFGCNVYKIYVKNKNEIYVGLTYPDKTGFGSEINFVLYNINEK